MTIGNEKTKGTVAAKKGQHELSLGFLFHGGQQTKFFSTQ